MKAFQSGAGTVVFEGTKEQLLQTISRSNGTLIDDRRFDVVYENTKLRRHSRLAFRFRCEFEEIQEGYSIHYSTVPTWRPLLVSLILLSLLLLSVIASVSGGGNIGIPAALVFINFIYAVLLLIQRSKFLRQFREAFQKRQETVPQRRRSHE